MMKNGFYFILICSGFLSHVEKRLDRKLRFISKFMTPRPGKQKITIHILPNITKSIADKTMKFGQLIEYNVRNIFLQISCRKSGEETSSSPLSVFFKKALYEVKASGLQ